LKAALRAAELAPDDGFVRERVALGYYANCQRDLLARTPNKCARAEIVGLRCGRRFDHVHGGGDLGYPIELQSGRANKLFKLACRPFVPQEKD
jgi:hypothetical protein